MTVQQFSGGHANLTYGLTIGDTEMVFRRPPFGEIPPGAHDMSREFRVCQGLGPLYDRAPRALAFCDDVSVVGAPFLIVERRHGLVIRDAIPEELNREPDSARRISLALIDALAELHAIDPEEAGLERLGRPVGFVDRQLAGWHNRWHRVAAEETPLFDEVHARLVATQPNNQAVAILHNDYKLDNVMFEDGKPDRVASIFDWDMASLGDPLVDLGTLIGYWKGHADPVNRAPTITLDMTNFPPRDELIERYASAGHNVDNIEWYEAFALWKHAVVLKQLHHRSLDVDTTDERLAELGQYVTPLIEFANSILHQ